MAPVRSPGQYLSVTYLEVRLKVKYEMRCMINRAIVQSVDPFDISPWRPTSSLRWQVWLLVQRKVTNQHEPLGKTYNMTTLNQNNSICCLHLIVSTLEEDQLARHNSSILQQAQAVRLRIPQTS